MLLLPFRMGNDRYALDTRTIVEVTPLVELRKLPQAPDHVAGIFNYRGHPIPVFDIAQLLQRRACSIYLSSRIILVTHKSPRGSEHVFGIMAEQVTETIKRPFSDFSSPGVLVKEAPYLTAVANDNQGMIQLVDLPTLIEDCADTTLFYDDDSQLSTQAI